MFIWLLNSGIEGKETSFVFWSKSSLCSLFLLYSCLLHCKTYHFKKPSSALHPSITASNSYPIWKVMILIVNVYNLAIPSLLLMVLCSIKEGAFRAHESPKAACYCGNRQGQTGPSIHIQPSTKFGQVVLLVPCLYATTLFFSTTQHEFAQHAADTTQPSALEWLT